MTENFAYSGSLPVLAVGLDVVALRTFAESINASIMGGGGGFCGLRASVTLEGGVGRVPSLINALPLALQLMKSRKNLRVQKRAEQSSFYQVSRLFTGLSTFSFP
jgi:hypothetical protein